MFLDTVELPIPPATPQPVAAGPPVEFLPWQDMPHSSICHHGTGCCEGAKAWFLAMDFSLLNGGSPLSGPRWIRERYEWGPSAHPIYWCEAVKRKTLDCGALAALAMEAFRARGVKSFPVQLVQRYSKAATSHWSDKWAEQEVSEHWIQDDVIYHEGCAIVMPDGTIKLWDASAAWWMNSEQITGYSSLAALRIHVKNAPAASSLTWGRHQLDVNGWLSLSAG